MLSKESENALYTQLDKMNAAVEEMVKARASYESKIQNTIKINN